MESNTWQLKIEEGQKQLKDLQIWELKWKSAWSHVTGKMISPDESNTSVLSWVVEVLAIIGGEECVDHMKKLLNFLGFLQWVSESDNTYATCSSTSLSLEPLPFYRCHVTQIDLDNYWYISSLWVWSPSRYWTCWWRLLIISCFWQSSKAKLSLFCSKYQFNSQYLVFKPCTL